MKGALVLVGKSALALDHVLALAHAFAFIGKSFLALVCIKAFLLLCLIRKNKKFLYR